MARNIRLGRCRLPARQKRVGRCHSGEHSPEYNEWLVSDHSNFNVDCVDCHVAHDNSLRLGDVNATCADCHENAMNDEIHMGEDMNCVDCHMTRVDDEGEVIHHTMFFDPKTCAECHGDIHTLQFDPTRNMDDAGQQLVTALETEVTTLEEKAETNLQSGIVGGAVGAMVLVIFLFIAVRLGRMRWSTDQATDTSQETQTPNTRPMTRREFLLLIGGLGVGIVAADQIWSWFIGD